MAECFIQGSFAFTCTIAEAALIEESWQHASDLLSEFEPGEPSHEFLAAYPPTNDEDRFSGFITIFDDADFPDFGADMVVEGAIGDASRCAVTIFSLSDFQPGPIASLISHCCKQTLLGAPIGFEWSYSCSRPRIGNFGGGYCAIFSDRTEFRTTANQLSEALGRSGSVVDDRPDPWIEHLGHPVSDWVCEVSNGDTRLGYLDWITSRIQIDDIG
ncbi:hypothetical protein ACFOKF_22185 [Sphingobium rhizovicinum]|uniref:YubB ferredoxin-like domain-containing protein n=1 Tax=Sphingobium rhizovicinum TaxID=432308 RepID=A0ABV7NN24_9SPHN